MTVSVGIQSGRELNLLMMLADGVVGFEELGAEEQMIVYNSAMDITTIVEPHKIEEFEQQMTIQEESRIRSMVGQIANQAKGVLQ